MAAARSLLNKASASFHTGISSEIEEFLKGAKKKKLKLENVRLYTSFMRECLHYCMTKMKSVPDKTEVEEILKTMVICAESYQQSTQCQDFDKTHAVLSLLFHTLYTFKETAHTHMEYVLRVSEVVFETINEAGCPETSHPIIDAFYSFLWNITSKHMKQGASPNLKDDLAFQKLSLQFFCCTSSNFNKICLYLQTIISHYTRCCKNQIDEGTQDMFYSIFKSMSDRLQVLSNGEESIEIVSEYMCTIYRTQVLLVEYLLSVSDFVKARGIIQDMRVSCDNCSLCVILIDLLSYTVNASDAFKNSKPLDISSEKIRTINSEFTKMVQTETVENLKLVFKALESFLQYISKVLHGLDTSIVRDLLECCTVIQFIYEKFDADNVWEVDAKDVKTKTKDVKTQSGDKKACNTTKKQDYVQGCCLMYYRQLTLLQRLLISDTGVERFRECVNTAQKLTKFMDDNNKWLTQESLHNKRNSFGSLCKVIGAACMQAGHFVEAATLYTIVIEQLHTCGQPNLIKMFEKLMDCYMEQEKWMEAIQTIVHAFKAIDDDLKYIALVWTKLRKEASSKDAIFQSMTLNSVIKSSGVDLKGVTSCQLLIAEYLAWKRNPKRQFDMEYPVFVELLEDRGKISSDKAVAMVALASNMCITAYKYNDMSAGELLNKAIILLDKNLAGYESTLAVACFLKYVILHEETVEYMKNETGDIEYFGTADISADSRYTLQQEQDNLPFLVRAIEMWEKSFIPESRKASEDAYKKGEMMEMIFGLDYHIDNLLLCGTRLIAMKQPQLALRALQVAKSQIANIKDTKTASDLSLQVSRSLMLLGRFTEAQSVMDCAGDNKKQSEAANVALHLSELYMLTGKRDTGLKILQSVLDSNDLLGKTYKDYFMQGTANRLLSMAYCLPGGDHMIGSTNQYLLSLAFESVHCQVTVLNFLTKNKTLDKNINKWLILNEILASMLHMCQLFRFIGLPREALCYLKTGLNISQGQGLPRWSCEFLMEMLGVQSMEAENDKALSTAESLDCILNPDNQPRKISNQSKTGSNKNNPSANKKSSQSSVNHSENSELPMNSSVENFSNTLKKTPERIYVKQELDSEKKDKMKKLQAPRCRCMVDKCDVCTDIVRHKLCMKAGIVLSDFLAQTDMKSTSYQLLTEVQSKFAILNNICSDSLSLSSITDLTLPGETSMVKNGQDPQLLYSCLEAGCIKAEYYLHKKDFHKVHKIWTIFQNMDKSGQLKNVLHSNILLTRLALCDASGYMLSLPQNQTKLYQSKLNAGVAETAHKLEKLSINASRKVSFEDDDSWSLTGTCMKLVRKVTKFADDLLSPVKPQAIHVLRTPVVEASTKKSKLPLTTPTTNRMMILENLIASDDEDDNFVFPKPKPITPGVSKSTKKSRMKSRTEPRNLIHKKPAFKIAEDPVDGSKIDVACKLNFQSTSDSPVIVIEDDSPVKEIKNKGSKARKQGKAEKSISVPSSKETAGKLDESIYTTEIKKKSNIPKRSAMKKTSVKTKKIEQGADFVVCEEGIDETSEKVKKNIEVLQEKNMNKSNSSLDKIEKTVDVFDFELEDSPVVAKVTKTGKTRQTKGAQRGKKTTGTSRKQISKGNENDEKEVKNKENDSLIKPQRASRRGRPKKTDNTVETARNRSYDLDECEANVSLEELTFNYDSFSEYFPQVLMDRTDDMGAMEFENEQDGNLEVISQVDVELDLNLEPIEIMRGDTVKKGKGGTRRGRGVKAETKTNDVAEEINARSSKVNEGDNLSEDESNDRRRSKERMRSGRLMSMNELTHADLMDIPSCIEETDSDCREPSSADMISTMESLYEKLCKFPPNPQHSDVCHMLALLHLNNNPLRAAFLLNDAIAVTFRHQVLLNLGKKARKEVKGSVASQRTSVPEEGVLFSGEDNKLRDMVKSIPEGWCVAQISVVSVGLPCKQMILTRFVRNEDPVVIKIPGFSSHQGEQALKDFGTVMEQSSKSAKIQSTVEWWETRRKLDNDMANVIERLEKHLLGHWRCAVTAGKFKDQILNVVSKEIHNITGKDVRKAHTELILIAHQMMTERELGQCISELLGINDPTDNDNIISVLKKYSKLNIGSAGKMSHTALILDKTVQHLPWESIPVLSDKSVSRMPCLSHLVTQLDKHYKGNNSVFVNGVNLQNTFYILTPDADLPRTQEFFQEWFQREEGWTGVVGCRPSSEQFIEALTQKDFLIFCGHGTGGRMFSSDEIEKLTARAVTMLMGCSSGKLHVKGQLEPTGMMISYFLAGCPSMVANLWDVTDKDIDKFTENVIKTWMSSPHGTYLTTLVQNARAVCKLKYLNGLAPVVYGLPVFINKNSK